MSDVATPEAVLAALVAFGRAYRRMTGRANRGGAPAGTGLTLTRLVAKVAEMTERDGEPPRQEKVAEELGLSIEWVRKVGRPAGGYRRVVELALAGLEVPARQGEAEGFGEEDHVVTIDVARRRRGVEGELELG